MRGFYFIAGLIYSLTGLFGIKQDMDNELIFSEGKVVEMTVNSNLFSRNVHSLKLAYNGEYYFIIVSEEFNKTHPAWAKVKVRYLFGDNKVVFPDEKFSNQNFIIICFFVLGFLHFILGLKIFPKLNKWFERKSWTESID